MNNNANTLDLRKVSGHFLTASISFLLLHYYALCFQAFRTDSGPFTKVLDRLQEVFQKLPFTGDEWITKIFAFVLVAVPSFFPGRPAERKVGIKWPLILLAIGLLLYFSTDRLTPINGEPLLAKHYIAITSIGYLIIVGTISRLGAATNYAFHRKYFQPDSAGFKQEEQLITTPFSLNFPATYGYNGRKRKSYINIINPRRGVLIMGSPGSGKSWFLIEPMIEQLASKRMALFVFDFKYPVLTSHTYNSFLHNSKYYPPGARFYSINFTDLARTHRCNIIDPATLIHKSDALGISRTILLSMNRAWLPKQGEFFVESPINFLAALIWFLKIYKDGAYCTLPHVIELSKAPYDELFTILNVEPETRGLIGPFKQAYLNKTMEMLDGQIASARIPLARLDSLDIYYVLSGNDLNLDINDPNAPAIFCLGGDQARQDALAPVLSLFIDRLNRRVNQPDRYPTALVLDEFATVRATSVLHTIATGRSNNIIPVLATQDLSQLTLQYSRDEAYQMMNTSGNLICGQVTGETARWVSERFHANVHLKTTISLNSTDTSVSKTTQTEDAITPAVLANLSSGEFVGVIADDPDVKLESKGFHATFTKKAADRGRQEPLPVIAPADAKVLRDNFERIGMEVATIVKEEMKRILGDPQLRTYIVKR